MTRLYLIRHGEAMTNTTPLFGGVHGDPGLTERGVRQAERLRDRLLETGEIHADVLIGSTFPRARQTAEIIAPALGLPIVWDDDVQEMRPGEADGMTLAAFKAVYGDPDIDDDPFRPVAPGGESWATFATRAAQALARIAREQAGQHVVIVCHGGVIDTSFLYFAAAPLYPRPRIEFLTQNTSITEWELLTRADGPKWRLRRYNDTAHLHDMPILTPPDWRDIEPRGDTSEPGAPLPTEE